MTDTFTRERREIVKLLRRTQRELGPLLAGLAISDDAKKALIAQNVLRVTLETVLAESLPYSPDFLIDLGTRLAAYTVTAGPPWETNAMLERIAHDLPAMVENKQKTGSGIKADWIKEGDAR